MHVIGAVVPFLINRELSYNNCMRTNTKQTLMHMQVEWWVGHRQAIYEIEWLLPQEH